MNARDRQETEYFSPQFHFGLIEALYLSITVNLLSFLDIPDFNLLFLIFIHYYMLRV